MGVLEIFYWCPGVILLVSWRYLMGVQEIFYGFPGHIGECTVDI